MILGKNFFDKVNYPERYNQLTEKEKAKIDKWTKARLERANGGIIMIIIIIIVNVSLSLS